MAFTYCGIKDLTLNAQSFFISALIIAKTEKRAFNRNGATHGVITFTVRDTKNHLINVSVFGSEHFIDNCALAHKLGDIISIYKATVVQKNENSTYIPRTTSPFELKIAEGKGFVTRFDQQPDNLLQLRNLAFKSTTLALRLDDLNTIRGAEPVYADLVVVVRSVEPVRQVHTKFGDKMARKVYLLDETKDSMVMTVWHPDYQVQMDQWKPLETILHLVDVQAEYSDFERATALSVKSKTVIIENPERSTRYATLMLYIHSLSIERINELKLNQPNAAIDPALITEVMSVKRILDQMERDPNQEIAAVVYGVVTKFDINSALIKVCAHCKRFLNRNFDECENADCRLIELAESKFVDKVSMPVWIADHSGTLKGRINDENSQRILGYTAQELKELPENDVDAIFNRFMLQRFQVKAIVKPKSQTDYVANILSIEIVAPFAMANALKRY